MNRRDFARLGLSVSTLAAIPRPTKAAAPSLPREGDSVRRVGIRVNGAYWGSAPEQIDALSGNLNLSIPTLTAKSRGLSVPLLFSYNSQLWEKTPSTVVRNGLDVGFGFGWTLQFGRMAPRSGGGYLFIDGTGAEYPLVWASEGWASPQGLRATYVSGQTTLYFWDGTVWTLGCKSASGESDAGSLYPTLIQDSNGNQIAITYSAGAGASQSNTSARIELITDARAQSTSSGRATYKLTYNSDSTPHLISLTDEINTDESVQVAYTGLRLLTDPCNLTTYDATQPVSLTRKSGLNHSFNYNGKGEVDKVQFPHGAMTQYVYAGFQFSDGRAVDEVSSRTVSAADGSSSAEISFTRKPDDASLACHSSLSAGNSSWTFNTDASSWQLGLALSHTETDSSGTGQRQTQLAWVQNSDGTPYPATTSLTLNPGTSSAATSKVELAKDAYGNVTQLTHYDYNASTPLRTVQNSYLNASAYTSSFIRNRLTGSSVTANGQTTQLASHQYDTTSLTSRSNLQDHDSAAFGSSNTLRGNVTESVVGAFIPSAPTTSRACPRFRTTRGPASPSLRPTTPTTR